MTGGRKGWQAGTLPSVVLLLAIAAALYGWNAYAQPSLWGYDAGGHVGYVYGILQIGGLPHPLSGWSTFHPPLYYLLAAAAWAGLEPLGTHAIIVALRLIGSAALVGAGAVTWLLARRRDAGWVVAWTTTSCVLFLPAAQLSASMVGNEALAAGLCALAFVPILSLQERPERLGVAAQVGLLVGLALATKYSAVWLLPAIALPYARRPTRERLLSLSVVGGVIAVVAGPVYLRNVALTETPFPMTRTLDPMRRIESVTVVRERGAADYLTIPLACGAYPWTTEHDETGRFKRMHETMSNVPCMAYTSLWFDPYRVRLNQVHADDVWSWAHALLLLGLTPTLLVAIGFFSALGEAFASRGRSRDAPLVAASLAGLASFVGFTWVAPSTVAAKGSYLLPLLVPAGWFFARGCGLLPRAVRIGSCAVALGAVVASIWVFTTGNVVPPHTRSSGHFFWKAVALELPESHIGPAVFELLH